MTVQPIAAWSDRKIEPIRTESFSTIIYLLFINYLRKRPFLTISRKSSILVMQKFMLSFISKEQKFFSQVFPLNVESFHHFHHKTVFPSRFEIKCRPAHFPTYQFTLSLECDTSSLRCDQKYVCKCQSNNVAM